MGIRIVEDKPDPKVVREVVCSQCGVKLEYLPVDIQDGKDTDYTGSSDPYHFITCPKCNNEVRIKKYRW